MDPVLDIHMLALFVVERVFASLEADTVMVVRTV